MVRKVDLAKSWMSVIAMRNMAGLRKLTLSFFLIAVSAQAHAAAPNIPPELLAQFSSMSPAEQRALAKQYGIDINNLGQLGAGDALDNRTRSPLGSPGESLQPFEQLEKREAQFFEAGALRQKFLADQDEKDEGAELERFGATLFDPEISTFAPVDNIPVPEGYRLGVGDELSVLLIGKEQGDYPLLIDRDGSITLPKIGRVTLSGLSFSEAKILVESRVAEQLIGTRAILSMGSLRSINVFIAGEVANPGSYSISALSTLTQALFVSGGVSETGSYRSVELKRNGRTVEVFDVYDLLLFGDNSADVRLQSGDVVFVPVVGPQITMKGEIVRPAIYEFTFGDTIKEVLKMAGGVKARGYLQQALLKRYNPGEALPSLSTLNLLAPEVAKIPALDGDVLAIRTISERPSNPIAIDGPTELDKLIGWSDGLRISDVFSDLEGDVKPTADLNLSLIVRRKNAFNDINVLTFSLSKAVLDPTSRDNVSLRPFDRVVILPLPNAVQEEFERFESQEKSANQSNYSTEEVTKLGEGNQNESPLEEDARRKLIQPIVKKLKQQTRDGERALIVNLSGAVQLPGEYPLLGNGSVKDLVALAGGYTDGAYLKRAEIRRISIADNQQAKVEFINIDLASDTGAAFRLEGQDTLRVNRIPNWSTDETVELRGEFLFPGVYTISQGETLSSLIDRAGGFTSDAHLQGTQFFSATARKSQAQQLQKIASSVRRRVASRKATGEYEGVDQEDSLENSIDEGLLGRVVIDVQTMMDKNSEDEIIVESGDSVFIPKFSDTIAVVGEVYEPGTFKIRQGASLQDYIKTAGGETTFALSRNTYLLKADGSVRFARAGLLKRLGSFGGDSTGRVEPGDVIVVPTNLDYDPPLARISSITNVVFQSLTSIAAFLSITKQ
jgi:polysaccharide export outer membrane protein